MKTHLFKLWSCCLLGCLPGTDAVSQNIEMTINASRVTNEIGSRHYGLFFEEINHAGDGGLYAELISNRSFEDNVSNPDTWWTLGNATMTLISDNLLNDVQKKALRVEFKSAGSGVRNEGFWGINAVNGRVYDCSMWIGPTDWSGNLTLALCDDKGNRMGETSVKISASNEWKKYTAEITATGDNPKASFSITADKAGTLDFDMVSLFPPTFNDRENGCRPDLANMLKDMKPAFLRFPGGCFVEGQWADGNTNRFEWKKTIGPIEERPGHRNVNWNYRVSDGMGFHEMLQLAEDIGAEPLFVVNMGMGHGWSVPYNEIEEYIQEALDAIEYCNGGTDTKWGALRAANGHPEPFNLRLIEIGNENYNFNFDNNSDQSDHYAERYIQFYNAIKDRYPEMVVIGNVQSWGTDSPTWRNPHPVDAVDEHYYRSPDWFVSQYNKYDSYSRSAHKIYVGEYAVTQNYGVCGNLDAALGEAVFMLGMERNADVCMMNSYAPIFVNENDQKWRPDMIRFNSEVSYGTPSYYVQKLMPNNVGTHNLSYTESNITETVEAGKTGVSTWSTSASYDNVKITGADGSVIYSDDFEDGLSPEWNKPDKGNWSADGMLTQSNTGMQGNICVLDIDPLSSYTLELDAVKNSGDEGFLVAFNYKDADNYIWWNLGGWGNSKHAVEICRNGGKTTVAEAAGTIETGRTYKIKITVEGQNVTCYLDGNMVHKFVIPAKRKVYTAVNIDRNDNTMYVKIVNPYAEGQTVKVNVDNATVESGDVVIMTASDNKQENNLSNPYNVVPQEKTVSVSADGTEYYVPAYSFNIIRLKVKDVQPDDTPEPQLPEPVVEYGFDSSLPSDNSGVYGGQLMGGASILSMNDGNKVLYTGNDENGGWMDLGAGMAEDVLSALDGDFTVTTDIMLNGTGSLEKNCWPLALANGVDKYMGIVNTANNTDWYFTMKENDREYARSGSGLSYGKWHTLTFVMKDNTGSFYLDGYKLSESVFTSRPDRMASEISMAALGKSPYSDDPAMRQVALDNVRFYSEALSDAQVMLLYENAKDMDAQSVDIANAEDIKEIQHLMMKFNYLHASSQLPSVTAGGTQVEWSCTQVEEGYVTLTEKDGIQTVEVNRQPAHDAAPVEAALLKAVLSYPDGQVVETETKIVVAPDDNRYGYLYCFMNANQEITNFALGTKEDKGRKFNVLLGGAEVFDTEEVAAIEHGTRDAYIARGEEGDGYIMTTTDMKQHASGVWNNHGLDLIQSDDLIHWSSVSFDFNKGKSIFSDPDAVTGCYDTDEEYARINRVWAPQVIWDPTVQKYLVYYSLLSTNEGDYYDKIYYSYADRDFKTLTQPRLFFDPGRAVIDADIHYNPYDGLYHMYYKKEGASGATRGIYEATSPRLTGAEWTDVFHITNEGEQLVEGSSTIRRINEDVYNVYYMRYSGGSAYKYCEADHLGVNISYSSNLEGEGAFQHGSFMTLTETEYKMLEAWDRLYLLLPEIKAMAESSGSEILEAAIEEAEQALAATSVETLANTLPEAYDNLLKAREGYLEELFADMNEGETIDISFLIKNPNFDQGTYGWEGTPFTQVSSGVAEHYYKTFDTYQLLKNMPAGEYVFSCDGFYRNGNIEAASSAHINGTENLLSEIYINDGKAPFMSLYEEEDYYSYNPYTFPDGVTSADRAFNVEDKYQDNTAVCVMEESGDIRLGFSKTEDVYQDWTCFDNFKLLYKKHIFSGIGAPEADIDKDSKVDIYTVAGIMLRENVEYSKAFEGLGKGIYIVKSGGKTMKVMY